MAEALVSTLGEGRFKGFSAGSHPGGEVNPLAAEKARITGYSTHALRSKSWDKFAAPDAPKMDFIITVCDNAAGEVCPVWPGQPISAHWGFEDPAAVLGTDAEKQRAFDKVFKQIANRIKIFVNLAVATLDKTAIRRELVAIGGRPLDA
jgi:arsenate reductase